MVIIRSFEKTVTQVRSSVICTRARITRVPAKLARVLANKRRYHHLRAYVVLPAPSDQAHKTRKAELTGDLTKTARRWTKVEDDGELWATVAG
jgi:hypothetical protein